MRRRPFARLRLTVHAGIRHRFEVGPGRSSARGLDASGTPASRGIGALDATTKPAVGTAGEVILSLPAALADVPLATAVRSTWLASSLRTVREVSGLPIETYLAHLSPDDRVAMLGLVPGQWLPIALAMAHYRACDRLQLSNEAKVEIGFGAARHAHQSLIGVVLRAAKASGVTPWTIVPQLGRVWKGAFVGSAVGATRLGPKELRMEFVGWPCASVDYCRVATRGVLRGFFELFCQRAYVTEEPARRQAETMLSFRISWA